MTHTDESASGRCGLVLERAVAALDGDDRPGQRALATAVEAAMRDGHHLVAQAPTGSGKSLAYLVPAITAGLRVVVATATLALQDQLWRKDLPHLQEHTGTSFTAALLKGRGQYLCRAKLDRIRAGDALFEERPIGDVRAHVDAAVRLAAESSTGDLALLDVPDGMRRALSCGPQECPGASKCASGEDCFAERARAHAASVDVLVVNHALYCAHLAAGGVVLPEHDVVVFDEAHGLADVATDALGIDLAPAGLRQVASRLAGVGAPKSGTDAVAEVADALEAAIGRLDGRVDPRDGVLGTTLLAAAERVAGAARGVDRDHDATALAQVTQLAAGRLDALRRMREPADGEVVWVEGGPRPTLRLAPITVGATLARRLFTQVPCVLVSATLGAGPRFAAFARTIGLDPEALPRPDEDGPGLGYASLDVDSPFDFRDQAMLYVPTHLPDRRAETWADAADDEICSLVTAAGGRALVLCTSRREVGRVARVLRDRTGLTVLAQGDGAKAGLVETFAEEPATVLVATRSFWMGVDVPGDSCVLVVIDRLPFPRPDDPLQQARRERIEADGGSGFHDVDLPRAALVLAQGIGRLIRTRTDRGVVAVLDRRLATARYRGELLAALPPMRRVIDGEVARAFLAASASCAGTEHRSDPDR